MSNIFSNSPYSSYQILKPRRSTTFSLTMKIDYHKNSSVTRLNISKSCYILFHFPLSVPPSLPSSLSYYTSLQSLFISLTCYSYKSSNPVVTAWKYRAFFICSSPITSLRFRLLISCAPSERVLGQKVPCHLCPLPSIKVYSFCCANTDFAVTFSLFCLCQRLLYFLGKW